VVLVHAGFLDRRMWANEVDALASDFRVVTVDARGVGASPPAAGFYRSDGDLHTVLDARGRLAPEAELITLDDAAHLINLDRPPRFAELVRTFIGSV
jgi:pimeloyl-ACP methyl ester carboxylesterase